MPPGHGQHTANRRPAPESGGHRRHTADCGKPLWRHAQPRKAKQAPSAKENRQRRQARVRLYRSGGRKQERRICRRTAPQRREPGHPGPSETPAKAKTGHGPEANGQTPSTNGQTAHAAQLPARERGGPQGNGGDRGGTAHARRKPPPRPEARRDGTLPQSRPQAEGPNSRGTESKSSKYAGVKLGKQVKSIHRSPNPGQPHWGPREGRVGKKKRAHQCLPEAALHGGSSQDGCRKVFVQYTINPLQTPPPSNTITSSPTCPGLKDDDSKTGNHGGGGPAGRDQRGG